MRNTRANRFFLFLTLTSVLLSPNGATLTSRPRQKIPVTSQPPGRLSIAGMVVRVDTLSGAGIHRASQKERSHERSI